MQQMMDNRNSGTSPEYHLSPPQSFLRAIGRLPRQYVRVLTQPSVETLSTEVSSAGWIIVLVQFVLLVAVTSAFNWLGHLIPFAALHTLAASSINSVRLFGWFPAPFNGMVFLLATFFIGLGMAYPLSRAFQGTGRLVEHTYLLLLFTVPLVIISGLLLLIPANGLLVVVLAGAVFALFVYRLLLHALAITAVHHLSAGRAVLIVLIIPLLIVLVGLFFVLVVGGDLPPDVGGTDGSRSQSPEDAQRD